MPHSLSLDRSTKLRLSFEEYIAQEFSIVARQQEDADIVNTRFIVVDTLVRRPDGTIGAFSYEISSDNIWVIIAQPILRRLDQNSFNLLLKVILEVLKELKKQDTQKSPQQAEIIAYNNIVHDLELISQSKQPLQQLERLRQIIFLLTTQFLRSGLSSIDPKTIVPLKSDKPLIAKLNLVYQRIRTKLYNAFEPQLLNEIKFRILPYYFKILIQDSEYKETAIRINPSVLLEALDAQQQPTLTVILVNTHLLEEIAENDLEILIVYQLSTLINSRKYNKGEMEKEIYRIIASNPQDKDLRMLATYYAREEIDATQKRIQEFINTDIEKNNAPIIQIFG